MRARGRRSGGTPLGRWTFWWQGSEPAAPSLVSAGEGRGSAATARRPAALQTNAMPVSQPPPWSTLFAPPLPVPGLGRYLKERNPSLEIIAVEPAESPVLSGGRPGYHQVRANRKRGAEGVAGAHGCIPPPWCPVRMRRHAAPHADGATAAGLGCPASVDPPPLSMLFP